MWGVGCGINMVGVAGRVKMLETEKCFHSCKMGEEGGGGGGGERRNRRERRGEGSLDYYWLYFSHFYFMKVPWCVFT